MEQNTWKPCVRLVENGQFDIEVALDFTLSTDPEEAQKQIDQFLLEDQNWVLQVDAVIKEKVEGTSFSYDTHGWDYADTDTIYLMGTFSVD